MANPVDHARAKPFHNEHLTRFEALSMLGGAAFMLAIAFGVRQSLGLFQAPIVADLGIATAEFGMAIALQNLIWGMTGPFAGALIDRFGTRWVAIGGTLLFISGMGMTAVATNSTMILIGTGIMVGISQACTTAGIGAKIAAQVVTPARHSLAFGIVSAVGSIGTFFIAPLGQYVIASQGWRAGIIAFVLLGLTMLPAAFIGSRVDRLRRLTSHGAQQSLTEALGEAARHRGYVILSLSYFVCGLQLTFITTHLPSYLQLCGLDPMLGAQALAIIGLFNVFGSWMLGWLGDHYRKRTLLGLVYVLRSIIIAIYFVTPVTPESTLIFAGLMGLLWLGVIPLVNGLVVGIFGIRFLSTLTGIAFFSHQVGSFVGAWGGGFIYDWLGSYDRALQFGVIIGLIAGCAQLLMDDRPTDRVSAAKVAPAE
ncbi:MAG: MFS transporter [Hyphomicrobiaceae bacterium]